LGAAVAELGACAAGIVDRSDDAISALQTLIGELTAEAATDASDEPRAL
jgi:hypothetical protein